MTVAFVPPPVIVESLDRGLSASAATWRHALTQALKASSAGSAAGWRHEASHALQRVYGESSSHGWDGYDARPVGAETFAYAQAFLAMLDGQVPEPDIMAHADGEIAFEWYRDRGRVFTVAVGRDGTLSYAGTFGVAVSKGREILRDSVPRAILESVRRVVSNA